MKLNTTMNHLMKTKKKVYFHKVGIMSMMIRQIFGQNMFPTLKKS